MPNSEVGATAQRRATWADAAFVALVVLAGATVYETAVALGALSVGPAPGQGPAGESIVVTAALLAMLVGGMACFGNAVRANVDSGAVWMLLAPSAAAFVAARFFTFDPYYAPTLRRSSDDGVVSPWWIVVIAGLALATAALTWARPRLGMAATSAVLVLCALAALTVRLGH